MNTIAQQLLTGERALFQAKDLTIDNCVFEDGESPLKESRNITVNDSVFRWKYPLWYSENSTVRNCLFDFDAHAAFWYSNHMTSPTARSKLPRNSAATMT